jgi:hypothetical protein
MKTLMTAILIVMLLAFFGCGKQEEEPQKAEETVQKAPEPPTMAIWEAAAMGDLDTIRKHIEAGSDLNAKEPSRGSNALITAVAFGQTEAAKLLIEAGTDVNFKNNEGSTALHTAALFCNTEIVQALLDKGIDKNIQNNAGRTALDGVTAPWEEVKPIYDRLGAALGPMGVVLDYEQIQATRPKIAEMLQQQ